MGGNRLSCVPLPHVGISLGHDWFMYFLLLASLGDTGQVALSLDLQFPQYL